MRAKRLCEYCLIHEEDAFVGCEVDHIIGEKHGGPTQINNLAYACLSCNRHKGSDIGSMIWETGRIVRFFHPRTDIWPEHFALNGLLIEPLTDVGKVTERIFQFNAVERLLERQALAGVGRYPTLEALRRITQTP